MPGFEWALLCDHALIDASGKLTLIGLFESITTQTLPAMHPMMGIVSRWRTSPGENFLLRTKLISPQQVEMASIDSQCQAAAGGVHSVVSNMLLTRFEMAGRYRLLFTVNEKVLGEQTFEVILNRPQ